MTRLPRPPLAACALALALLSACASRPPEPAWQGQAHSASQRALSAYLSGQDRVAAHEWQLARRALSATGQPQRLAQIELLRCAAEAASVITQHTDCPAFAALQADADAHEAAYAAYLAGQPLAAAQIALLPAAQQAVASATAEAAPGLIARMTDPLAQLVAAGVQLRRGAISPALAAQAAETASAQGWARPLLAWLGVQRQLAQQAGQADEAARLQRRMDLITRQGQPGP